MPAPARPHFPPLSTFRAETAPPGPVPRGFLRGETWPPARPWPGRAGASGASGARGFVLHSDDWEAPGATKPLPRGLALTATVDILRDISAGRGPRQAVLALGYAGWAPGQLEAELQANGWLTCPSDPELVFGEADEAKWETAMRKIGVDPALLSSKGGSA